MVDDLSIRIASLPTDVNTRVDNSFVDTALRGLAVRAAVEDTSRDWAQVDAHVYASGNDIFATGSWAASLTVACARCLADVSVKTKDKLAMTFVPQSRVPKDEFEEGEDIDPSEADVFGHDGEVIDLNPVLKELLVLTVPYAPLCMEDCLGLCASCGANKNEDHCECSPVVDPRLAALQDVKL